MRQVAILLMLRLILSAAAADPFRPEFYAFQNGVPERSHTAEAKLLKQLGYDGISQVKQGGADLRQRVAAYRRQGLKVLSLYLDSGRLPIAAETYAALGESDGMIELTVRKTTDATVRSIRQLAGTAQAAGVRVVLYPHHGFAVATLPQAMKLAEEVDHPNLGIMFNLCHFLKGEKAEDLEKVLRQAAPRLMAVSTCGADVDGSDWNSVIRTLDRGSFPQARLLRALAELGYKGPVSLQGYNLRGSKEANLERSAIRWRQLVDRPRRDVPAAVE